MSTRLFVPFLGALLLARLATAACGDGVVDPGEQCDRGPDVADDCCTATCDFASSGTSCLSSIPGACDDAGVCVTPLVPEIVRIRTQTPGRLNGSIVMRGTFVTAPPADTITAPAGITMRVTDGLSLDRSVFWPPATCVTSARGGIRCDHPDGLSRKVQLLPPRAGTTTWGFKFRLKSLDTQAPFAGPFTIRIDSDPGVARLGSIDTCTTAPNGALNCRTP